MYEKLKRDKTILCDLIGYSPESKIIEYLLEIREHEFTFNDIVTALSLNRKRAYEILRLRLKQGIVEKSKKVKHIQFYKLNRKNQIVKILIKLFDSLIGD